MQSNRPYSNADAQVCARLLEDPQVMEFLQREADSILKPFRVVNPSTLPAMQSQYDAILTLMDRINGVRVFLDNNRQSLANKAGVR